MPAVSKAQQRFFGMVRAAQKGEMKNPSSEILDVADDISVNDAKKMAKTKHKGLPEKVKEELVSERLGGKGYKPYTSLTGKKVSGDWEDSDRGAGNKAKRRAGGKVEKKSPTYQAYVLNKEEDDYSTRDSELKKTKKPRDQRYKTLHKATNDTTNVDVNEDLDYRTFIKNTQDARDRVQKRTDERKKKDAAYVDRVKKGIKFYDKKGKGHIRGGKKVYD
tara:strand:- start:44 stop:700 length:657 start_codon:yes stop_codon:yes gene_type:complete